VVAAPIAAGYALVSAQPSLGSFDPQSGSWTLVGLDPQGSATLRLKVLVLDQGPYELTAELIALDTFDPDSTPGNHLPTEDDQATVVPVPQGLSDLSLSMAVDQVNPPVGGHVRFTVLVRNHGPATARGVEVENLLPVGYTYISHSATAGEYDPNSGRWQVGRGIPEFNTESLEISAQVNAPSQVVDQYLSRAQILASLFPDPDSDPAQGFGVDDLGDGLPDDDEATAMVAPGGVDLELQITVDRTYAVPGEQVIFTVRVSNLGPDLATHIA